MQFNVPQFTDIEDKVIGPLSMKQFLMFLGGGLLLLIVWYLSSLLAVIIIGLPLVGFLAASVFVKINGRSFFTFFSSWVKYLTSPRIYVWKRK